MRTRAPRRYTRPDRYIYFLRRADGVGPIKLGCTLLPERRLLDLARWSPEPLELLATAPGSPADERVLQKRFDGARLHFEWFDPTPEFLELIGHVKQTGTLPTRAPIRAWAGLSRGYEFRTFGDEAA